MKSLITVISLAFDLPVRLRGASWGPGRGGLTPGLWLLGIFAGGLVLRLCLYLPSLGWHLDEAFLYLFHHWDLAFLVEWCLSAEPERMRGVEDVQYEQDNPTAPPDESAWLSLKAYMSHSSLYPSRLPSEVSIISGAMYNGEPTKVFVLRPRIVLAIPKSINLIEKLPSSTSMMFSNCDCQQECERQPSNPFRSMMKSIKPVNLLGGVKVCHGIK